MARPTASLAVYLQQFGRALRTLLGKSHGLIIDHVSNWKRHGFPDKPHRWTLARAEKKSGKKTKDPEDIPLIRCSGPECGKLFEKVKTCCPYCATPVQIAETGGGRATPEQVDGDLILLDAETIARMQAAIQLEHPEHLAQRAAFAAGKYAGIHRERTQADRIAAQQALIDAMAMFSGQQKARGRTDDRENMKRFYHMAGIDVLSALALPKAEMENLTRDVLAWVQK